jgi:beta-glucosidase
VNQTGACENRELLDVILKEELDFRGFLLSDWAAVDDLYGSVNGGADVNMPGWETYADLGLDQPDPAQATNSYWGKALGDAVRNGTISEARLDDMVSLSLVVFVCESRLFRIITR